MDFGTCSLQLGVVLGLVIPLYLGVFIFGTYSVKKIIRSSEIQILLGVLSLYFLIWPPENPIVSGPGGASVTHTPLYRWED